VEQARKEEESPKGAKEKSVESRNKPKGGPFKPAVGLSGAQETEGFNQEPRTENQELRTKN
jgi:hypothetical protein